MIYELLDIGKENAKSSKELIDTLNFDNARELRKQVARERLNGYLILSNRSSGGGYYKPSNDLEIKEFITTLENEAYSVLKIAHKARKQLGKSERGHYGEHRTDFN